MRRTLAILAVVLVAIGAIAALALYMRGLVPESRWSIDGEAAGPFLFSPDGKTLINGGNACIELRDPATGVLKSTLAAAASPAAISPAGDLLACTTTRRPNKRTIEYGLELWDLKAGARLASIEHYGYAPVFSPDGKTLATVTCPLSGGNSTIELWSIPSLTSKGAFARPSPVSGLCFSPDDKLLASGEKNVVELLDVRSGISTRSLKSLSGGYFGAMQFYPDGRTLVAVIGGGGSGDEGGFWTWDLTTGRAIRHIQFDHSAHSACYSADGKRLAVRLTWYMFSRSDRTEVWDTSTGRKIGSLRERTFMWSVALSPDGTHLVVGFQQPHFRTPAPVGIWQVR